MRIHMGTGTIISVGCVTHHHGAPIHGAAVSIDDGGPELRVSGLSEETVRAVGGHLYGDCTLLMEVEGDAPADDLLRDTRRLNVLHRNLLALVAGDAVDTDEINSVVGEAAAKAFIALMMRLPGGEG